MRIPSWRAVAIAMVPFAGACFSVPLWDRAYPMIFGMPFNLVWLLAWIPLTSVCLALAHRVESARDSKREGPK
jgi:Protein of unknown function (DUF3311)